MDPKKINTFVIVLRGNETSEYYYSLIKDSWYNRGFNLNVFEAFNPSNFHRINLKFKPSTAGKYVAKKLVKEFTPSEKAAFVSHYVIWNKIAKNNIENALIIEHDARLNDYDLFEKEWNEAKENDVGVKLFGQGASCYTITPGSCKYIARYIYKNNYEIDAGPMGYIAEMTNKIIPYKIDRTFEKLGGEINLPVQHIYNEKYGNTIDKYSNLPRRWQEYYELQNQKHRKKRWILINE